MFRSFLRFKSAAGAETLSATNAHPSFRGDVAEWVRGGGLYTLITAFALLLAIDLWPLLGAREGPTLFAVLPDEFNFMQDIARIQKYLLRCDFKGLLDFGTPCGYGYVYWLSMGLLGLPVSGLDFSDQVLYFRLVGTFFKAITAAAVYSGVARRSSTTQGLIAVIVLFSMPAFWFYGKVISPEWVVLALLAVATVILQRDEFRAGRYFWISFVVFSIAAVIKMSLAPAGLLWGVYLLLSSPRPWKDRLPHLVALPVILAATFFLTTPLFTEAARKVFAQSMQYNSQNTHAPSWSRAVEFYRSVGSTWDRIPNGGMRIDFMNVYVWAALSLLAAWGVAIRGAVRAALPTATAATFLLAFVLGTQIGHGWYLMAPFLLCVLAWFACVSLPQPLLLAAAVLAAVNLGLNAPRIQERYAHRLAVNRNAEGNFKNNMAVQEFLLTRQRPGEVLIAHHFSPVPVHKLNGLQIATGPCFVVEPEPYVRLMNDRVRWLLADKQFPRYADLQRLTGEGVEVNGRHYRFVQAHEFSHAVLYERVETTAAVATGPSR